MDFLYFPENKLDYIPSVIMLIIFFFGAVLTMKLIKKASDKELQKTKNLEAKLLKQDQERAMKQDNQ
jgi:hypothetical protein